MRRSAFIVVTMAVALLLGVSPVLAHGEATGVQEFLQHNLVTIGFLLVIVSAAAALVWRNRPNRRAASPSATTAAGLPERPAD